MLVLIQRVQESNLGGRVQVLKNVWDPLQHNDTLVQPPKSKTMHCYRPRHQRHQVTIPVQSVPESSFLALEFAGFFFLSFYAPALLCPLLMCRVHAAARSQR